MSWLATLGAHWGLMGAALAVLAFVVLCPGVALALARWLIGTERGRYVLLATIVAASFFWYRGHLIASVRAACVAEQAASADRARADAAPAALDRNTSAQVIGDKTQADTAGRIEQGNSATQASQERTRDRIAQAPATGGCAGPDPGVMRDVQASDARLRAAADRMWRIGTAPGR